MVEAINGASQKLWIDKIGSPQDNISTEMHDKHEKSTIQAQHRLRKLLVKFKGGLAIVRPLPMAYSTAELTTRSTHQGNHLDTCKWQLSERPSKTHNNNVPGAIGLHVHLTLPQTYRLYVVSNSRTQTSKSVLRSTFARILMPAFVS